MTTAEANAFQLPPLILHPFSSSEENSLLLESSKASLALRDSAHRDQVLSELLESQLLRGRYAELRMLFYIGKDITRWTEQCAETAKLSAKYAQNTIRPETFAVLLVENAPVHVRTKLEKWGVLDFRALFRRSFGLHGIFDQLPTPEFLSPAFLKRYHRYLDQWYEQWLQDRTFDHPDPDEFTFDLYASGEYSSMLEKSWAEEAVLR
ncbi:MAG: hypothetical protein M3Y24_04745 [Acidobacteriota bacterium]|nr:hypothetical protein [Acidobacteriota bacterium]